MKKIDLTGLRFGRWIVLSQSQDVGNRKQIKWNCRCDCGSVKSVQAESLKNGASRSCGCLAREAAHAKTHGMSKSRIYRIYRHMLNRCGNDKVDSFPLYGGRGIAVCAEWGNFEEFYKWSQANGYADNLSIDRIDNNKGYGPNNCQWSSVVDQARNKRNTVGSLDIATKVRALRNVGVRNKDVSAMLGISRTTVSDITYNRSWAEYSATKRKGKTVTFIEFEGEIKMAHEWSKDPRVNVNSSTILRRKAIGMSDCDALFAPRKTRKN